MKNDKDEGLIRQVSFTGKNQQGKRVKVRFNVRKSRQKENMGR